MVRWFVDRTPRKGTTSVSLRRLLPEAQFVGCADWEVTGCTHDHRRLEPGQLFVASRDAHVFVREALERGAAGVVVERHCPEAGRLQAIVPNAMAAHGRICQALAGNPAQQLVALGVTGSFGKTITALMIRSIIDAAGERCGLLGSFGFCDGVTTRALGAGFDSRASGILMGASGQHGRVPISQRGCDSRSLVPGAVGLAALLAEMVKLGCQAGVFEVSKDALAHHSFDGIAFQGAVVTDVADSPGVPQEILCHRRRTKAKLFHQVVHGGVAIVNADDPNAEILGGVNLDARRVAFAVGSRRRRGTNIDVSAQVMGLDSSGTRLRLYGFDREADVQLPLVSLRAASCAVAAAALAWALEINPTAVVAGLEAIESIAGHLEKIDEGQAFEVRIDAAQTPEALGEALTALRAITTGRVHCVMSAEGGSDRTYRRRLAETAEFTADRVILTTSNPRAEEPNQVLDDLLAGFHFPGRVRTEPDRRTAIHAALADARPGDVVLIAGKGQNSYQIFADRVVAFDDDVVIRQWLRSRPTCLAQRLA
jgi:UDP-N-acetylmuramoyl-L-alanyl-D-glutamate--2,6-diaminopimelate ligase